MSVSNVVQFAIVMVVIDYLLIKAWQISVEAAMMTAGLILLTILFWIGAYTIDGSA